MSKTLNIDQKKIEIRQTLFTWSNAISFSRILVAFPIVWLHYHNGQQITWVISALVFYGVISDFLDGYIARKNNEISEWGKVLDPVADKICAFILFFYAVYMNLIPFWFFIVEIIRDAVIVIGSLYIRKLRGKVAMAIMSGKISVNVLGLYWLSVFFFPQEVAVHNMLMGASLAVMIFSFFDYLHRYNEIRKGIQFN